MAKDPHSLPDPKFRKRGLSRPSVLPDDKPPPPPPEQEPVDPLPPDPRESLVTQYAAAQAHRLVVEIAKRKIEALRLYRPLPHMELFHQSRAPERIIRGSNRAGKTLAAAVEVARAVTGQDPFNKYPKRDGLWYCVGNDGKHIWQVMWPLLGRAGAFKIIRDLKTREWRPFLPWEPEDAARAHEAKPAPPLIPPRMIREISWENKKDRQPKIVRMRNGWQIEFFSGNSNPPQGTRGDGAWFDEEIPGEHWYNEISARLTDNGGLFFWSATPQVGTDLLFSLHERAEREAELENPSVVEVVALIDENPHITQEQKQRLADKLETEEQIRVRIRGEFALASYRIYPEFSMYTHGCDYFEIPAHWTRYAVIDPGRQVCAVLFAAIPAPEDKAGDHVFLYDELYLKQCNAEMFGERFKEATRGQVFHAFIIDAHGARIHEAGSGLSVEMQLSQQLKKHRIRSVRTGYGFIWGSDDIDAGILAVKSWLRIREDGTTKLKVLRDRMRNFNYEIKRYRHKVVGGEITDRPLQKGNHLMDCLRYLAMHRPRYHRPPPPEKRVSPAVEFYRRMVEQQKLKTGYRGGVSLGPRS